MAAAQGNTRKHRDFVGEPPLEKLATALPGIGDTYGPMLREAGFNKAYNVIGQFLVLNKDRERFKEWLKRITDAREDHAELCYNCIREWCYAFM